MVCNVYQKVRAILMPQPWNSLKIWTLNFRIYVHIRQRGQGFNDVTVITSSKYFVSFHQLYGQNMRQKINFVHERLNKSRDLLCSCNKYEMIRIPWRQWSNKQTKVYPEWPHRQGGCFECWRLQGRSPAEATQIYTMHEALKGYWRLIFSDEF